MRMTVDIPDSLFREAEALAAIRGITIRRMVIEALERAKDPPPVTARACKVRMFPSFHLRNRRKMDLEGLDFDDLLV
jgi:hypothetical protein